MTVTLAFLFVLLAGAVFWLLLRRGFFDRPPRAPTVIASPLEIPPPVRRPGHMLHPGEGGCASARRIETAWFAGETPGALPLDLCDHPEQCRCRWTRVYDRRQTLRRAQPDRRGTPRAGVASDRRQGPDRRQSEGAAEPPAD